MEILSVTEIWRWLRWLPNWILKRIFNRQRLADLIIFDVKARHSSVSVDLGEPPTYGIWFQIINMSPFEVELDRSEFSFVCAGSEIKIQHIKSSIYKSGEVAQLYVHGDIPESKANHIARLWKDNRSYIGVHCEFKCVISKFVKSGFNLEGVNVEFRNAEIRKNKSENIT